RTGRSSTRRSLGSYRAANYLLNPGRRALSADLLRLSLRFGFRRPRLASTPRALPRYSRPVGVACSRRRSRRREPEDHPARPAHSVTLLPAARGSSHLPRRPLRPVADHLTGREPPPSAG